MTRGADERRKMVALRHVVGLLRQGDAGGKDKRNEPSRTTSKGHENASLLFGPGTHVSQLRRRHSLMSLNAQIDFGTNQF
jgi:hypothetical protein